MTNSNPATQRDDHTGRTERGIEADVPVLTTNGWVAAGALKVDDAVLLATNQTATVTGAARFWSGAPWRIAFNDGSSITTVGAQDLLLLHRYGHRREWTPVDVTVEGLAATDLRRGPENRFRIPLVEPLAPPDRDLPVDPYVLGAHIANGHAGTSVVISTPDPEVIARLEQSGGHLLANNSGACERVLMPRHIQAMRALGLAVPSRAKFVPTEYLAAGLQQRIDLLHGLMDGDGSSSSKGRSNVTYSTTSPQLADDVVVLANTLGGTGRVIASDRSHHGKPVEYTVTIMLPQAIEPFFTVRKRRGTTRNKTGPGRAVAAVERAAPREMVALRSDSPGSTIVVGQRCVALPLDLSAGGRRSALRHAA